MERTSIIRSVTTRLRNLMNDRRKAFRRASRYEARLPLTVTPHLRRSSQASPNGVGAPSAALVGHTRDLSEMSMTLLLPSVRIRDTYLTDSSRHLEVRLELPEGAVSMLTSSVRFEQLPTKDDGCGYLLAVRIVQMEDEARARYLSYLAAVKKQGRHTHERRQQSAPLAANQAQSGTWDALNPESIDNAFKQFLNE